MYLINLLCATDPRGSVVHHATSLQGKQVPELVGKQGVQGAYALVRGGSSTSNLVEPYHYRDSKVFRVLSHEFGVVRLYRTFSSASLQGK